MACLSIKGLKKRLGEEQILNGVDLDVKEGEIMGLVGPSGSGKTTLLRCLNRLIEIDEGEVQMHNKDIKSYPPVELRRSIVLVHQESAMFPGTVYDNVAYGPSLMGEIQKEHILKCLKDAGLPEEFAEKDALKLSGGEKKRVALARALALKPEVLLLDEPTAGVDPKKVRTVERTIVDISKKKRLTILWVTHYVDQAKRVSDRIANLKEGRVREVKRTEEFQWEGAY